LIIITRITQLHWNRHKIIVKESNKERKETHQSDYVSQISD